MDTRLQEFAGNSRSILEYIVQHTPMLQKFKHHDKIK